MTIFFRRSRLGLVAAPVVIIGSIYLAWAYVNRAGRRRNDEEDDDNDRNNGDLVSSRSMSMGVLQGGKLAFKRLIEYHDARAQHASFLLQSPETELKTLLAQKYPDFNKLQSVAAKLEMSGKEAEAVKILEEERLEAIGDEKWHEVYEIEMLLAEMLIYKGDFEKAFECSCLENEEITDPRRPLFKAILHILLEHPKEEAKKCWEEFAEIESHFEMTSPSHETQPYKVLSSFNEFEKVVNVLKRDINEASKRKKKKS